MSVGKVDAIQDNDVPNDRIDGYLPLEWKDIHAALRISAGFPSEREGWRFFECPDAPLCPTIPGDPPYDGVYRGSWVSPGVCVETIPGDPPYDGVYRGSWVSPGVCVVLKLSHPYVPRRLSERLRELYPQQVGRDGAFYEFGIKSRSQRDNCETAFLALLEKCQRARGDQ